MKKILSIFAFLAISAGAFAQDDDFLTFTSDNEMHALRFVDHVGIGLTSPMGDNLYTKHTSIIRNYEAFINVLTYKFIPAEDNAISLGVDLGWNRYMPNKDYYFDYQKEQLVIGQTDPIIKNLKKNWLDKFSVQIPLDYTRSFGPADLTIGASAEFNLPGYCRLQGDSSAEVDKYNYKYKGIKLTPFTANVHVSFTIYNIGVYAKYSPMKVMSEAQGPEFTTWTVGLFFK